MTQASSREQGVHGRVLVIDDDERSQRELSALLIRGGFQVVALSSPIGATQLINTQDISAVVVDLNAPALRGARFAALVQSWDRVRDLPVVLIADDSEETRALIGNATKVAIAPKRDLAQVVRVVEKVLALRGRTAGSGPFPARARMAARPTLAHFAQAALRAWKDYVHEQGESLGELVAQLVALRSEAQGLGLAQTSDLVGLAIDLAERCEERAISDDCDQCVSEMLSWLSALEVDTGRGFEHSMVLSFHRARLERALVEG